MAGDRLGDPLQLLVVDDSPSDAVLLIRELEGGGFDPDWLRVETLADLRSHLAPRVQVILADYKVPGLGALEVLEHLRQMKREVPVIVVSGTVGEEYAVECLRAGAVDFVVKDRLGRLVPAVRRILRERRLEDERRHADEARRASEARLSGILASIQDVVWSFDYASDRMLYLSPAAEKLYGRPRPDFLVQPRLWVETVHPDDRPLVEGFSRELEKWGVAHAEFRIVRSDGTVRFVQNRAWASYDERGNLVRAEGVIRDLTDERTALAQREAATKAREEADRLRHLNEVRNQLLSAVAHEINNPLTPLKLQVAALARLPQLHGAREALDIIARNVNRIAALLQDLLDVTRMESGRFKMETTTVDAAALVQELVAAHREVANERGLTVHVETKGPVWVQGDPKRLGQVVGNLLSNAFKFTPQNGSIFVKVLETVDLVQIQITDTGRGIAAQDIDRLFQPFVRLQADTAMAHTGTGLGLYLSKAIVEQHHGHIYARSPGPGRGSTFVIELPAKHQRADASKVGLAFSLTKQGSRPSPSHT